MWDCRQRTQALTSQVGDCCFPVSCWISCVVTNNVLSSRGVTLDACWHRILKFSSSSSWRGWMVLILAVNANPYFCLSYLPWRCCVVSSSLSSFPSACSPLFYFCFFFFLWFILLSLSLWIIIYNTGGGEGVREGMYWSTRALCTWKKPPHLVCINQTQIFETSFFVFQTIGWLIYELALEFHCRKSHRWKDNRMRYFPVEKEKKTKWI